jgi:hypothetical protein
LAGWLDKRETATESHARRDPAYFIALTPVYRTMFAHLSSLITKPKYSFAMWRSCLANHETRIVSISYKHIYRRQQRALTLNVTGGRNAFVFSLIVMSDRT